MKPTACVALWCPFFTSWGQTFFRGLKFWLLVSVIIKNPRREPTLEPPTPPPSADSPALDFPELVQRYGPAWRLLAARDAISPDDCVQEALLNLVRQIPAPADPVAWMFKVVRNLAIDQRRREASWNKHRDRLSQTLTDWHHPDPSQGLELAELSAALDELNDDERTLIVGKIWGQLTFAQLGEVLGCSTPTALRRYRATLEALGSRLAGPNDPAERDSIQSTPPATSSSMAARSESRNLIDE